MSHGRHSHAPASSAPGPASDPAPDAAARPAVLVGPHHGLTQGHRAHGPAEGHRAHGTAHRHALRPHGRSAIAHLYLHGKGRAPAPAPVPTPPRRAAPPGAQFVAANVAPTPPTRQPIRRATHHTTGPKTGAATGPASAPASGRPQPSRPRLPEPFAALVPRSLSLSLGLLPLAIAAMLAISGGGLVALTRRRG